MNSFTIDLEILFSEFVSDSTNSKTDWYDQLNQPILVTEQPEFEISILAFEKVKQRIENGNEDNIPFFFAGYSERVKKGKKGDKAMIT